MSHPQEYEEKVTFGFFFSFFAYHVYKYFTLDVNCNISVPPKPLFSKTLMSTRKEKKEKKFLQLTDLNLSHPSLVHVPLSLVVITREFKDFFFRLCLLHLHYFYPNARIIRSIRFGFVLKTYENPIR